MVINNSIEKWKELLVTITNFKKSNLLCSIEEIEQVEKELGFKFPFGYKEFCLVFGSGSFGIGDFPSEFSIYCPCCPKTGFDIRNTGYHLIGLKLDLDTSGLSEKEAELPYRLLENGYAFSETPNADSFFWDLTSYREDDQSYDIYWKQDEDVEQIELIGRDFFEFVDKFCLGNGVQILYMEIDEFEDSAESKERFFKAFENYQESSKPSFPSQQMFELTWKDIIKNSALIEDAIIKLTCSYDAANQEQADCIQKFWNENPNVKIETISPGKRLSIPQLINIKIVLKEKTRESFEEILTIMKKLEKECNCPLSSFGSEIN